MKKTIFFTIGTLFALMITVTGCGENVSNNLGGATRGSSTYVHNYGNNPVKAEGEDILNDMGWNNGMGAGYWDYYGITDGISNTTAMRNGMTGTYTTPNTATDGTMQHNNTTGTVNGKNSNLDSASIAD